MQAVETVLKVLGAFVGAEPLLMLKTISERAQMHPAKVHRYLVSLCRCGYVQQDEASSRYRLSEGALRLGHAAMDAIDVIALARPRLKHLRDTCRLSAFLATWERAGATIAIQEIVSAPVTISVQLQTQLPLLRSSTGRAFGAWLPEATTRDMLRQELKALRAHPVPGCPRTMDEALALFAEVRKHGVARATGQFSAIAHGISAPVFDGSDSIVAVLTMLGPAGAIDTTFNGPPATTLRATAEDFSRALGWVPSQPTR